MEYLSVSEYAELYGKDPGNIRRHLASGRLKGQKIGNQWVISADAPYPADNRQSSGKYKNWKKRLAFYSNKLLVLSLENMISDIQNIYKDSLDSVVLYGSYARGTQDDESDIDIAIFLRDKSSPNQTDLLIECVSSYEIECGKILSVIDIQTSQYNEWKTTIPFYRNIEREGIILWKAA